MNNLHKKLSSLSVNQLEDNNSKEMQCALCPETAIKTCSTCKSVGYCSLDHQKLDRKKHKKECCQAFSIEKTEDMGMGWFATRDLPAGFILLEEKPVIQAPSWNKDSTFTVEDMNIKCLCCGVTMDRVRPCSTCSWPLCSYKCEKNPLHMDNECKEFVARKIACAIPEWWEVDALVLCTRANVMKLREPEKFEQLMALRDFHDVSVANQELQNLNLPLGMLRQALRGPNSLDQDEFQKLLRICKVNGYLCEFSEGSQDLNTAVYLKSSRINHSCSPNCTGSFGPAPGLTYRIRTSIPVKNGDQLFINYYDSFDFEGTTARQQHFKSHGFICKCQRCLDPTEFGTFLSGIKCSSCSSHFKADSDSDDVGFLLPANPLDINSRNPELECFRCHVKVPFSRVLSALPTSVGQAFRNIGRWTSPSALDMKSLENLLTKYDEDRDFKDHLHPNHWLIQRAMRIIVQSQRKDVEEMTPEDLKRRVERLEYLLFIDYELFPGLHVQKYEDLVMLIKASSWVKDNFEMPRQEFIRWSRTCFKAAEERLKILGTKLACRASVEKKLKLDTAVRLLNAQKQELEELINGA